jgi:hypothetical protein
MTIEDDSRVPPKRRVGALAKERAAREILKSTNEKLGEWQMEVARLAELGRRATLPKAREQAGAAARALLDAISAEIDWLTETIRTDGDGLMQSGRVADTRQALASIRRRLDEILGALG